MSKNRFFVIIFKLLLEYHLLKDVSMPYTIGVNEDIIKAKTKNPKIVP